MAEHKILKILGALCFGAFYCKTQTIMSNIQNFIQMATDLLKGVSYGLKKIDEGLKSADEVINAAQEETCEFNCPKGEPPRKKDNYKPKPNGCGAYGIQLTAQELPVPEMTDCCNQHDVCYGTCLAKKERCDQEFERCLVKSCEKQKRKISKEALTNCKGTAKILFLSTLALGCKAFKSAQLESCWCSSMKNEL